MSEIRNLHRWLSAVALALFSALPLLAESPACSDCHGDVASLFVTSRHGKAFAQNPHYTGSSCASCHQGAEQHAESGDPADIVVPRAKLGQKADASCITCHEKEPHAARWLGSAHQNAGLTCVDCHSVHNAGFARKDGRAVVTTTELCLSCHNTTRVAMSQRSRHPLKEGKMDCASCHDPHGALSERLVKADSVNDLCLSCHQQLRGPFLWEHSPVRENCLSCHQAHGSNHDKLLVARASQLCQSCHLQGRHQTVAGFDASIWNSNRSCINCHSQIHGSNHPSGPLFQR